MNLAAVRLIVSRVTLGGLLLCATGCSSFHREWKRAGASPTPPAGIEGRWEGTWRSDVNQHTGRLRCLITRGTNDLYRARFHAKYRKVIQFSFGYTVPLTVTERDGAIHFEGAAELGWLAGGRYTYTGRTSLTNFSAGYSCQYDHGVFEMARPDSTR